VARVLPTPLLFTPIRLSGASDFWIGEARLDYPNDGVWHAVTSIELADGLIKHETVYSMATRLRVSEYLAESCPPPDWRRPWIEPLPVDP
jgi:hypothetical protein